MLRRRMSRPIEYRVQACSARCCVRIEPHPTPLAKLPTARASKAAFESLRRRCQSLRRSARHRSAPRPPSSHHSLLLGREYVRRVPAPHGSLQLCVRFDCTAAHIGERLQRRDLATDIAKLTESHALPTRLLGSVESPLVCVDRSRASAESQPGSWNVDLVGQSPRFVSSCNGTLVVPSSRKPRQDRPAWTTLRKVCLPAATASSVRSRRSIADS